MIKNLLTQSIVQGLRKKAVTTPVKWAERYRVMGSPYPGNWSFDRQPWLLEMHLATADKIVGQKAAQMGFTEWAMNLAFYYMDVKKQDVLYVLPTTDDASNFSASRFDPALELSPYLNNFFGDVNNVGLKRGGNSILYVRGSKSRSKLKSIPAPVMIWDEVDEMPEASLSLGEERQSGQEDFKTLMLSTPSIKNRGINAEFNLSTQDHYFFKCPCCSRRTELIYPECLVLGAEDLTDPRLADSHLVCKECNGKLPHETKTDWLKAKARGGDGEFVSTYPDRLVRGVHISQLYSMTAKCHPKFLAEAVLKARFNPSRAQELFNSKLGLCFAEEGSQLTDEILDDCLKNYLQGLGSGRNIITMGVDVGGVLNIKKNKWEHIGSWHPGLSINDQ